MKASSNAIKHGVSFEQATEVFRVPLALTILDENNSTRDDERWITLGQIGDLNYLVVVHAYRNQSDDKVTIRIISA